MRKKFNKINIEISNICNLQCGFCPAVVRSKALMSVDLFRQIIRQVAPLTEQVCLHLMGEPLVHPRLKDFVDICQEFAVRIFFVSNGVLLREESSQLLLHPAFRQVNFSLHSFKDNYPDRDPEAYLKRLFVFTEQAFLQRPDLYVNYRLWNLNQQSALSAANLAMLHRIAEEFNIDFIAEIEKNRKKSYHLKNRLYLHFDTEFIWPSLDLPILGTSGRCYGLNSHFGILVDGTVVPCCLDKEGVIPLGKIHEQPLLEILASPRAQALFAGFQENRLIEELCQRCQYIERFSSPAPLRVNSGRRLAAAKL